MLLDSLDATYYFRDSTVDVGEQFLIKNNKEYDQRVINHVYTTVSFVGTLSAI